MATRKVILAPTSLFVAVSIALTFMVNPAADAATKKTLKLLWSDEFNGKKGTLPSTKTWTREIGGGGWGNSERQFYTDKAANASMDGAGRLVITANRISNEYGDLIGDVLAIFHFNTAALKRESKCHKVLAPGQPFGC